MAEEEEEVEGTAVELRGLPPSVPDELLTLYFENRRRSGGGTVLSWWRLGYGGIITFREPEDAQSVLAQTEHQLHGARLSLQLAPPFAPARLLLQGLTPSTVPQRLEQHIQVLLGALGHPVQPCRVLASPRPDRTLIQLPAPLSEAEFRFLEGQTRSLDLDGVFVSLARVPQARAVRVVGGTPSVDPLLLELYLENERRSGGGALGHLRSLPGQLGTVVSFQQWQVAERVLQRDHCLQGSDLSLVPHYDFLDPEEPAECTGEGDRQATIQPAATDHTALEAGGLTWTLQGIGTETGDTGKVPGQLGASLRTSPSSSPMLEGPAVAGSLEHKGLVNPMSVGLLKQEGPTGLGSVGSPEQAGLKSLAPMGLAGPVGPTELSVGLPGQEGAMCPGVTGPLGQEGLVEATMGSPVHEGPAGPVDVAAESPGKVGQDSPGRRELLGQEGLLEVVLPMEPGEMRFMQLYHGDLLASLEDVALFPLEGMNVTGFQLCGAQAPCQVAQELLQSVLGSISSHVLDLKHPGSASFLLGTEGQHLLQELEAEFQCVFGIAHPAGAAVDTNPEEGDPIEALQVLSGHSHTLWPQDRTGSDQENMSQGLASDLATLPSPASEQLEEELALQLALHRSLKPVEQVAEQEAAALRQALALSLLEHSLPEVLESPWGRTGNKDQLVVHVPFEQDMEVLDRALVAALEAHLQEETVRSQGRMLPMTLLARLERCHGVTAAVRGDHVLLCGFGAQPARAARHLAVLLAGPWDQNLVLPVPTSSTTLPEQTLKESLGRRERLGESSREFQEVVQAFYSTLDSAFSRICIIRVERVSHPLLEQQYQLHRQRLVSRCTEHPAERVLYHGTSASAVPEICAHGFNRSFCGRNGTLYGQGVYFALRASLSVQDRYSPPNADGHKAVFVARVLTGDFGQGSRDLRAPPLRAPGHALLRYDSAVDSLRQPSIFVIFHDTQALPTHLITCERAA
ncbi:protein mono-ADP-ribosyltransferase PARP10 [Ctenodactylus gundi]